MWWFFFVFPFSTLTFSSKRSEMGIGKVKTLVSRCCGAVKIQFPFFPLNIECFDEFYDDDVNSLMVARSENGHRLISIFATFPRIALARTQLDDFFHKFEFCHQSSGLVIEHSTASSTQIHNWLNLLGLTFTTNEFEVVAATQKRKENSKTQLSSRINRPTDDTYTTQPLHHRHLLAAL